MSVESDRQCRPVGAVVTSFECRRVCANGGNHEVCSQDVNDWLGLVVYGFLSQPSAYYVRVVCTLNQDIFGDGKVDVSDVQYVAGYWQAAAPPDRADRDNDGDVDIFDISLVAGEWNTQC